MTQEANASANRRGRREEAAQRGGGNVLASVPPPVPILTAMTCRQLGAAVAQLLFPLAGSTGVAALRLSCSAVVLMVIWYGPLRRTRRQRLPVRPVIACGIVLALMNFAFYQALDRIPMGVTVAVELLGPLALAVAGSRRLRDVLWVLLAGGGVLLLTDSGGHLTWGGVGFALIAAACWVGYILFGARLSQRTGDGSGLALSMVAGSVIALPIGAASTGARLFGPEVLGIGFAVALLSSVLPYSLEFIVLRRMPPRTFGLLMSLEPVVAALIGLMMLGQRLETHQWLAILCIIAASMGVLAPARLRFSALTVGLRKSRPRRREAPVQVAHSEAEGRAPAPETARDLGHRR